MDLVVEPPTRLRIDLERQPRLLGGLSDDLADLGALRRRQEIGAVAGQAGQRGHAAQSIEEIRSHGGDHPDEIARRQHLEGGGIALAHLRRDAIGREQLLELIDDQKQAGFAPRSHSGRRGCCRESLTDGLRCLAGGEGQQPAKTFGSVGERRLRQFRQRTRRQDRRRQTGQGIDIGRADEGGGTRDRPADERDASHHAGFAELGQQPRLDQARLSRSARPGQEDEGRSLLHALAQQFADFVARLCAAEEDLLVLALKGFQPAVGRSLVPPDRRRGGVAGAGKPFAQKRRQVFIDLLLELRGVGEGPRRRGERLAGRVPRPAPHELFDQLGLALPFLDGRPVAELALGRLGLAIQQKIRQTALAGARQRIFELPFGAGDGLARYRTGEFLLVEENAKPRPQDNHDDVGVARRHDEFLKRLRCHERFAFPQIGLDPEVIGELAIEAPNDTLRDDALGAHIHRRRDEDPNELPFLHPRPPRTRHSRDHTNRRRATRAPA